MSAELPDLEGSYQSFILRVYMEGDREPTHGQVTHVRSRSRLSFVSLEEAPSRIRGLIDASPEAAYGVDARNAAGAIALQTAAGAGLQPGVPLEALPPWGASKVMQRTLKRGIDIAFSLFALALLVGPMLLVALAIKLDSPGPVIYKQRRAGQRGRIFTMYKFRSMRMNADDLLPSLAGLNEAAAPLFKIRNDPRKTRVGRVLRRLSFDELPQLFNVLKGDLSLVGPRPPLALEVQAYLPAHWQRLAVPQGITGLWQVSGRSLLNFDEMLELDVKYVRSWSLGLDLVILLRTIPTVLSGKGAF